MIKGSDVAKRHVGTLGIKKILAVNHPPVQMVIDSGVVPYLLANMKQSNYTTLQVESAWALTNVASGT